MRLPVVFMFLAFTASAQTDYKTISWQQLGDVVFEDAYDQNSHTYFDRPIFGTETSALEGEGVRITGYVIPIDLSLNYYVLSAFPFNSCFFCGGAGPESVVDLQLTDDKVSFKTDERATFCGTLRLNRENFFELPFVLERAKRCD